MLKHSFARTCTRLSAKQTSLFTYPCLRRGNASKPNVARPVSEEKRSSWSDRLREEPPKPVRRAREEHRDESDEEQYGGPLKEPPEPGAPSDSSHLKNIFDLARTYSQDVAARAESKPRHAAPDSHEKPHLSSFGLRQEESYDEDHLYEEMDAQKYLRTRQRSSSIRINNAPENMTQNHLMQLFSPYGKINDVQLADTSEGKVASVTFSSPDQADKLIDLQEQTSLTFEDTVLELRFGSVTRQKVPSRTIFVAQDRPDGEVTEEFLRNLFGQYAPVTSMRRAVKKDAWFVDFASVKAAGKVMDIHEARPFRTEWSLLRLNYEETNAKFEQPHHTLCITGFEGTSAELKKSLPRFPGGDHVIKITSFPDSSNLKPPLYFIKFESVEYATRTLGYFRQSSNVCFSAKYAGRPSDKRVSEPRRSFPPSSTLSFQQATSSVRRESRSKE